MSIALALVAALAISGCVVRYIRGTQLSGTCAGACDHYLGCRGSDIGGVASAMASKSMAAW